MGLPPPPPRIGRYEVVGRLATGGMAEILLGRLTGPSGFERPVVVKRILPHLVGSEAFSNMFLDEARLVARIRHPNVVQVQELGEVDGELFLAMEYLEGESVAGLLKRLVSIDETVPLRLAAYIVAEACAGLHAAHELTDDDGNPVNLVHRDVSPQNIFVLYGGGVRLLDFGVAKAADRSSQTAAGELKGKFQYMSPEQCLGKPLDRRSDIFALGVVLFELTTSRRLFKRDNELLTFKAICELPVPRPREFLENYPEELERIVLKALARKPDNRYQNASEMRRELLAAARMLGASDEPAAELSQLMHRTFQDRIEEKRAMLRRVSAGSGPTPMPGNDADPSVDLPAVTEWVSSKGVPRSAQTAATSERKGRSVRWAAIMASLLAVASAAYFVPKLSTSATPATDPPAAAAEQRRSAPAAASASAAAVPSVTLTIASRPSGAAVFLDGKKCGSTTLSLDVPRSETAVELALELPGYETMQKQVVPDQARSFDLAFVPLARKPRPATKTKKPDEVPLF